MSNIIDILKEENTSIHIERDTGMISLTKMFQSQGQLPAKYTRLDRFKKLKNHLQEMNVTPHPIVKIVHGDQGGTWVHKDMALDAAMWCSPELGLAVHRMIRGEPLAVIVIPKRFLPKGREDQFTTKLAAKLDQPQREVKCVHGRIDILTPYFVVEVKTFKSWKSAIGQVTCYGLEFPKHEKVIALFDCKKKEERDRISNCCRKLNIDVWFLD